MTKQADHLNEEAGKTRVSKREAVAAFYERILSGTRRRRSGKNRLAATPEVTETTDISADDSQQTELNQNNAEEQAGPEQKSSLGPRNEVEWNDLISHRIEEAMRNGAFDNLRNKGKPLPNSHNPHVPEDRRMANDLLKNNGLAPQWINDRTATLHLIETFRDKFQEVGTSYQAAWHAHATDIVKRQQMLEQWATQLETWQDEMRLLNRRIDIVNLQQPVVRLEIFKLILDEELKRVGMTRELA